MSRFKALLRGFLSGVGGFCIAFTEGVQKHGLVGGTCFALGENDIDDGNHGYTGGLSQALFKNCWLERAAQPVDRV
jgi:hypothetical protein